METYLHTKAKEAFSQRPVSSHLYKFKHTNANMCPPLFAHTVVNARELTTDHLAKKTTTQ